jgi:hypothetical protein
MRGVVGVVRRRWVQRHGALAPGAAGVRSFKPRRVGRGWWQAVRGTRRPGRRPTAACHGPRAVRSRAALELRRRASDSRQHAQGERAAGGGRLAAAPHYASGHKTPPNTPDSPRWHSAKLRHRAVGEGVVGGGLRRGGFCQPVAP